MFWTRLKPKPAFAVAVALAAACSGVASPQEPSGEKGVGKKVEKRPDVIYSDRLRFDRTVTERVVTVAFTTVKAEYVATRQFQDPTAGKGAKLLRLQDSQEGSGGSFYAYLSGKAEAQIRRLGLDPEAYFRDRLVLVTGRVECVTEPGKEEVIAGGDYDRYRLVVTDLDNIEVAPKDGRVPGRLDPAVFEGLDVGKE